MSLLYIPFMLALLYFSYPSKLNKPIQNPDKKAFLLLSSAAILLAVLYIAGYYPTIFNLLHEVITYLFPMEESTA